jgi:hypothetical protein
MMNDVAHQVMADHFWTVAAVTMIWIYCLATAQQTLVHIVGGNPRGFRVRLKQRAKLCLDRTGFVGALIARHTLMVTVNVLALNLSLNLLSAIRAMDDYSMAYDTLKLSLYTLSAVCIGMITLIAAITLVLCNEIVRQAEDSE